MNHEKKGFQHLLCQRGVNHIEKTIKSQNIPQAPTKYQIKQKVGRMELANS